jgi:hypothetical protein
MIINCGVTVRPVWKAWQVAKSTSLDAEALGRTLRKQEQVMSKAQTASCGMTGAALRHRLRPEGPWQQLLPQVYLAVTGTPTVTQWEIAAVLYAGPCGVITGIPALRRHGMRVPESMSIAVLVPPQRARLSQGFVQIRPTTRMPELVCYRAPVQYALPERAVADAAREMGSFREVRGLVADAVQRGLCRVDGLVAELEHGPRRGSAWLRRALAEVADGIRSGAEGDFRDLIRKARLPIPVFNATLYAGREFLAVADAWWPEAGVAGEVESREWHLSPEDWEYTLTRSARLTSYGIKVLHFTPGQIRSEPARVAADIRNALAAGQGPVPTVRAVRAA